MFMQAPETTLVNVIQPLSMTSLLEKGASGKWAGGAVNNY